MSKTIFIVENSWAASIVTYLLCEEECSFKRIENPSDDVLEALENVINGSDLGQWNGSIWQSSNC